MPAFRQVEWGKGRKDAFRSYLHTELTNCLGDRGKLESKWRSQVIQWRARVTGDGSCDVPYIGALDLEVPLTDMHVQPVLADFMQSLHAPKDFWSLVALRSDAVEQASPLQEFLSLVERRDIKMRRVNQRTLLDVVVHGTGVYKDSILHDRKKVQDYNQAGSVESVIKLKFQPMVEHVPLRDFFIPAYAWNIDPDDVGGAPWVGHRFYLNRSQFKQRANAESPFLPAFEKKAAAAVETWETNIQGQDVVKAIVQQEDEYVPWREDKVTLYEIWVRFDVDGDGIDEDVVAVWHHDTREVLRATHVPLIHGKRPFEAGKYLPFFGFYGLGMAEADQWAQLAISRLFNGAVNNAELANTVMLGVPLGANIMPDESIYPGKIWPLGSGEKISEVRMGQPYPGIFELISGVSQWAEQRTAISELRQGNISSLPSRTPASTVLQLLGESNKRFDMIMANLRDGPLSNIGQRVLQNVIQISKDDPRYIALAIQALGEKDGSVVAGILQGPVQDIESNFGVSVTATSSKVNKEIDKQNLTGLAQFNAQVYPALMQYAQALVQLGAAPPELITNTLQAAFNGTSEFQKRLIEAYDIQNPEQYLPAPIAAMPPAMPGMPPQQPGMGPMGAPVLPAGGPQAAAPLAQAEMQLAALLGLA